MYIYNILTFYSHFLTGPSLIFLFLLGILFIVWVQGIFVLYIQILQVYIKLQLKLKGSKFEKTLWLKIPVKWKCSKPKKKDSHFNSRVIEEWNRFLNLHRRIASCFCCCSNKRQKTNSINTILRISNLKVTKKPHEVWNLKNSERKKAKKIVQ